MLHLLAFALVSIVYIFTPDSRALFFFTERAAIWGFTGIWGRNSDVKGTGDLKSEGEKHTFERDIHIFKKARKN